MVLSFSLGSKEFKSNDPLAEPRASLEDIDIKAVIPYITNHTTHVVQNKRNTAKGLQALLNGGYIVKDSYINALVYASTPRTLDNQEALCPLEVDFDASWPDPFEYLPPRGKEPTQQPDDAYKPMFERQSVFEGYTFVFCDDTRFSELHGPITNGHGKALIYEIEHGKTTAEEIADYMKKAAGPKGLGQSDYEGGVILVRIGRRMESDDWEKNLESKVVTMTGQQIIETSDFLDAILRNDASGLMRPAPNQNGPIAVQPRASEQPNEILREQGEVDQSNVSSANEATRPKKRSKPVNFVSKMKTFDDGFDMNSIPTYTLAQDGGDGGENASMEVCTFFYYYY